MARKAEGEGEAAYIHDTGAAKGAEVEAVGLARAKGFELQARALGPQATALVNAVAQLADSHVRFVPEVLVSGGNGSGTLEGLAGTLIRHLQKEPEPLPKDKKGA